MSTTDGNAREKKSPRAGQRLALRREMTFGELFTRFPQTKLLLMRGLQDVDPVRDADLTLGEYAARFAYGWGLETSMGTLNNALVLLENADAEIEGDPAMVDWTLFHGLDDAVSPELTRPPVGVSLDKQRLGVTCDGGLPNLRWVLSDGLNAVVLHQTGAPITMLTAFQRVAGMSCERLFDGEFLDLRVEGQRHSFDQVHLGQFGYENHSKADPQEKSSLLLWNDRMWLNLARPGKRVEWVIDDSTMVLETRGERTVLRHGWDEDAQALVYTTIDDRPNLIGVRPEVYEGFTDEEVFQFVGTEWPEQIQGAKPMHTEAWVAFGPGENARYAGSRPVAGGTAARHTFMAEGSGCLIIALGSTRQGALAELKAAREGQDLPRRRQEERYARIAARAPRLEVAGHETVSEIAALIPPFLESLKTGFVLMRSRPHTGAICGGWDQLMIAQPMVRVGDYEMTPRYLEHWLHQIRQDGQIFHVSDVDLGPAVLFKRWDFDDYLYLMLAGQWIAHTDDQEMLQRLAAKCTHMLRVMLDEADPQDGLIAGRGIYPDWPTLETGRVGLAFPALENGAWYDALRWWEGLAERLGETVLCARIRETAEKIRGCFADLFLDAETGMIMDAVYPVTHQVVRTSGTWSLSVFQGSFGHELFTEAQMEKMATWLADEHLDLKFPYVKNMVGLELPGVHEHLHWPLFDHLVAKAMRRGNCARGLGDLTEIIERQYRWMHVATEAINAYYDLSHELLATTLFWFGWGATGWYEALLSGVAGLWEEPGGLAYVCCDQDQEVHLSNLPYRGGVWEVEITGAGRYVDRFEVDGQVIPGVCKLPQASLIPGAHRLVIHRADQPPTPLVLDSTGLKLIESSWDEGALRLQLAGPGRALVRFYCASQPEVSEYGQPLDIEWDAATGTGRVMIDRGEESEELTISVAG
ncbi:MAG TPA: hypothetical protein VGM19_08205 [Armatimonadota bacterium]|jgi:hypothetical protein